MEDKHQILLNTYVYNVMYKFHQVRRKAWDMELGIKQNKTPISDDEIMSYLTERKKRRIANPDYPPYDPCSGL